MRYPGTDIRITVNDIKVCYNDEGADGDPVIIFVHGFPLSKSMWDKQLAALKDHFRAIAYDLRGHGSSDPGNENFSIELFVHDLLAFMDALKINKTVLCGLSMGGYIALNAVENHPDRFNALILCDTNCMADTPEAKQNRLKAIENINENGVEKYADESINNLFANESLTAKKAEISAVKEMIKKTTFQSLTNTLLALSLRRQTCSKLPEIKIPTLIIVGKEDKITPPDVARLMQEKIHDSVLFVIEHAGHLSNMENPGEFNEQLRKFIASVY